MASEIRTEHLGPERLDDLVAAQNEMFSDYIIQIHSSREFFLDFLRSVGGKLGNVILALDDEKIVGYVNPVIDGREAWIGGVGVIPSHRRRGIATMLMKEAEEFVRKQRVERILLEVIEGNDRAYDMYLKLGYKVTRKFLTAEGKPEQFTGFEVMPRKATLGEILPMHETAYADSCWQKRKLAGIAQAARAAECYKVDGGFVLVRIVQTTGFIPFLGVVPAKRGRGVGTSLAKFALNRLQELGAFKVSLYNVNEDEATIRLMDKFDFAVTLKQMEMLKVLR